MSTAAEISESPKPCERVTRRRDSLSEKSVCWSRRLRAARLSSKIDGALSNTAYTGGFRYIPFNADGRFSNRSFFVIKVRVFGILINCG